MKKNRTNAGDVGLVQFAGASSIITEVLCTAISV